MNFSLRFHFKKWRGTSLPYLFLSFAITLMLVDNAQGQVLSCGVYIKPPSVQPPTGPLYTDRFGNTYSQQELEDLYQNAAPLQCASTGVFNPVIQTTSYMGNTYPTQAQEDVICDVFAYLSSLVTLPSTGGPVNIHISFDPFMVGSGNAGVGTPLWGNNCGIGYSIIQEQLNLQPYNLPSEFAHGTIRINPQFNWYTEIDQIPVITNQQVDLYTVVLHEAMHSMGFASTVGATGNALDGFYTLYDLDLKKPTGANMIIPSSSSGDCCKDYTFNTAEFPNMPTPILTCGNVRHNVTQNPPAHRPSGTSTPGDGEAANILSHLNIICGTDNYVMHPGIGFGVTASDGTPNIRRTLTAAELEIMCKIGYDMSPSCDANCLVIVGDDGPFVLNEPIENIPLEFLTQNDFDAEGNYQIIFDFSCGNTGNMTFTSNNSFLTIASNNTPLGQYEVCYTITSCNGELCQSGTITLVVMDGIDPSMCKEDDCNLAWYGDFELFTEGFDTYYSSFLSPWSSQEIGILNTNGDFVGNTVDVWSDGINQFLRFIRCPGCDQENVLMPLCSDIPSNCDVKVEFDACANLQFANYQPITLGVWGLSQLPDPMELPYLTTCNGILMDNSGNVIGTCLGEASLMECDGGNPSFSHFTFTLPNSLTQPISHLWFFDYPVYPPLAVANIFLDNVVVTTSCQHQVTINPTVMQACIGGQAVVELEVCLDDVLNTTADFSISPNLQGIPGTTLSSNNPDFPNGTASIQDMEPGECITLTLFLDLSAGFAPGTELTIPLTVTNEGACIADPDGQDFTLTMEECLAGCDCPPGSLQIGSPGLETLLSQLVASNQVPASNTDNGTPLNLTVSGTLVIDATTFIGGTSASYTFPNLSSLCMGAGARIRVPANNTLRLRGTHLSGCEKRWEGIIVETNGKLDIGVSPIPTGPRCWIEDAQHAVRPMDKSTVSINRADFENNFVSLFFNTPGNDFTLQTFIGNNLSCTSTLKPHYDSQSTEDGPWSYAGIQTTEQGSLSIGADGSAPKNTFTGLRNGILTENCNLTLRNSQFSSIAVQDYPIAGYGVRAIGAGQTFNQSGGCGGANNVIFSFCNIGISIRGMNANVRNNTMSFVNAGVEIRESANRNIDICSNVINCTQQGVALWFNDPANQIHVHDNDINVNASPTDTKSAAILVRENGAPEPNAEINSHYGIDLANASSGISMNGANGYNVHENHIYATRTFGSSSYTGFWLWNSSNNILSCNYVNGDFESNPGGTLAGPAGIKARASTGVTYDCNGIIDTYLGMQFDMDCGSTDLRTTNFQNHHFGLHYQTFGITGAQPFDNGGDITLHGNRWNGTWGGASTVGARHESPDQNWVNESQYIVPSINAPFGPQNPSSASGSWFISDPTEDEFGCGAADGCAGLQSPPNDPPIRELDKRIAQGLVDPGQDALAMKWMLDRNLFKKLYDNTELIQPRSVLETFYNAQLATSIGEFTAIESDMHGLYELDASTAVQLQSYYSDIVAKMDEIATIDDQLQTATGQTATALELQRTDALALLETLSLNNKALASSILQARSQAANALIAQNNSIAVAEIWEQNEKMVNHIFLNTLAKGIAPNYTQINLLRGIALQCPYEGGIPVFRARALLDGLTEDVFDDETLCGVGGAQMLKLPKDLKKAGYILYPNPTQGMVNLKMPVVLEGKGELQLFNLYGQPVSSFDVPEKEKQFSFSTDNLQPGIYLVRLLENGEETFSTKLILVK